MLGGGYDDEYEREPAPLVRDLRRTYYTEARMVALIGASTLAPEPTAEDPQR
ncbi:MAG: hypothetical protein IPK81_10910 [Rhodospirillales bacterium]|nr:MAG: hypothetical protein IPK81_10910 [Rhodospirillales bacterium]